jgi:hypothetical protein
VVEVAEEEVGEELHGGVEFTVGLVGWGNNQRRLPPARCSWMKTMAGKSRGPAGQLRAAHRWEGTWSRATRRAAKWWEGKSEVGDNFLGDAWSSAKGGGGGGALGTGVAHGTGPQSRAVKWKRADDMWAQPIK